MELSCVEVCLYTQKTPDARRNPTHHEIHLIRGDDFIIRHASL